MACPVDQAKQNIQKVTMTSQTLVLFTVYRYHERYHKPNEQLFSQKVATQFKNMKTYVKRQQHKKLNTKT